MGIRFFPIGIIITCILREKIHHYCAQVTVVFVDHTNQQLHELCWFLDKGCAYSAYYLLYKKWVTVSFYISVQTVTIFFWI